MAKKRTVRTAIEPMITMTQAGVLLGVSTKSAIRLFKSGELRGWTIGTRLIKTSESAVKEYLDRQRHG